MARFLNHSYPGRKALLFVVEQTSILAAATLGAAVFAAVVAGDAMAGGAAPIPRILAALGGGPLAVHETIVAVGTALLGGARDRVVDVWPWALVTAACCGGALYAADLYDLRRAAADRSSGGRRTLLALAVAAVLLVVAMLPATSEARGAAIGAMLFAAVAVVALRTALPAIVGPPTRVLVLGAGTKARDSAWALVRDAEANLELAGFVPTSADERWLVPQRLLVGGGHGLVEAARRARASWIVVALDDERGRIPTQELVACRVAGIVCLTVPMLHERVLRRLPVEQLRPSELAFSDGFEISRGRELAKRAIDVTAAGLGLLLAAPLLLLAALAIRIDSRGPIFYGQERVGKDGKLFRILKLRSMRTDAESGTPQWAQAGDPRVTRVGKLLRRTRIDEIPQLFAVLKGEMSLVGPRPERPFFVEQLKKQISYYGLREAVRPGVTGWAQLRYPYGASVEDARAKLEYDLYYIKNGSAFLDLAILFHTVKHVLMGRGAR